MTDQQREQIRREAEEACPHKATYGLIDKMTRGTWIAGYNARAEKACPVCEKVGLAAAASGQSFEKVQGDICTVLAAWERCKWRQNDV